MSICYFGFPPPMSSRPDHSPFVPPLGYKFLNSTHFVLEDSPPSPKAFLTSPEASPTSPDAPTYPHWMTTMARSHILAEVGHSPSTF